MYYDDLTNNELQTYHNYAQMDSVSVCLAWMQASKLFEVQSLGNNVYKIYPLFYVDKITCTEANVKILDNKCVILIETEDTASSQTYINFISNQNGGVIYQYDNVTRKTATTKIPVLQLGDTLSTEDYNNLVQVIRDNVVLNNPIKILDGVVTGSYGRYQFNIKDVSLIDNGILITEETITNGLTVTLLDPIYEYSTYELILSVAKISDVHLDNSSNTNFKTITTLNVTLQPFEEVTIPVGTLQPNTVILYEANVQVTHNKPYIQQIIEFKEFTISTTPYLVDSTTLTAKYFSDSSYSGKTVTFKAKKVGSESFITLGTGTTNNSGVATLTFTPLNKSMSTGDYVYYAYAENSTTNSNSYNYMKKPIIAELTANYNYTTNKLTVTGVLKETITNTNVTSDFLGGVVIKVSKDGQDVAVTNPLPLPQTSSYSAEFTINNSGTYTISAVVSSDYQGGYEKPTTTSIPYTIKTDTTLSLVILETDSDGSVYSKLVLKDVNNQPIANRVVNIIVTHSLGTATFTRTTDTNGEANNPTYRPGYDKVVSSFDGDTIYNGSSVVWERS